MPCWNVTLVYIVFVTVISVDTIVMLPKWN